MSCLALLVACGTSTTQVTQKVATLGYPSAPAVALVTRGKPEAIAAWSTSLRAATGAAQLVDELAYPDGVDQTALCTAIRDRLPGQPVDELVLLDSTTSRIAHDKCIDKDCPWGPLFPKNDTSEKPSCTCKESRYEGATTRVTTKIQIVRMSTCHVVATHELPVAKADASPRDAIEYTDGNLPDGTSIGQIRNHDLDESERNALDELARVAARYRWSVFPRAHPTVRPTAATLAAECHGPSCTRTYELVDRHRVLEAERSYWVKQPDREMTPGARVANVGPTSTIVETTGETTLEPRDELHATTDELHFALYTGLGGGTVRAASASHGTAALAAAGRIHFAIVPLMADIRLEGDVTPGIESARWFLAGAGGFRLALGPLAPIAFVELGVGAAYQDGARAVGGLGGLGAGLELALGKWLLFADLRRRYFLLDDWKRQENGVDVVVEVPYPDSTWISTTLQLGVGGTF